MSTGFLDGLAFGRDDLQQFLPGLDERPGPLVLESGGQGRDIGAGLGSAVIADGVIEPMELAHLPYRKATFEDYVGIRGLKRLGEKEWRRAIADVVARLSAAVEPDYVVLGGGNVKKLKELPPKCRAGDNANAFLGGFRLWEHAGQPPPAPVDVSQRGTSQLMLKGAR